MNEDIYAMVCRLYFKSDSTIDEIVQIIGGTLLKYRHRDEDGKITKFNVMSRVVEVIIDNELQAHKQAKQFVARK
jgi:hypothetical protein